jgi:hypothetical protein
VTLLGGEKDVNTTKVASIHRQLARLHAELAEEIERDGAPANDSRTVPKRAKRLRKRQTRVPYKPPMPSDIDVAAVKSMARKAGIHLP